MEYSSWSCCCVLYDTILEQGFRRIRRRHVLPRRRGRVADSRCSPGAETRPSSCSRCVRMSAYEDFFTELVRLEIDLWGLLDELQASGDVASVAQLQALRAISSRSGAARVQDLSGELHITVGAASKLIDRLERDGLATRAAHPTDRRSMVITLTSSGEAAFQAASASSAKNLLELLSGGMTERQASELATRLSSVRSSLHTVALA